MPWIMMLRLVRAGRHSIDEHEACDKVVKERSAIEAVVRRERYYKRWLVDPSRMRRGFTQVDILY